MVSRSRVVAGLSTLVCAATTQATLLANWDFNDLSWPTNQIQSNAGQTAYAPVTSIQPASLDLVGWSSSASSNTSNAVGITNFQGTSLNAVPPATAGRDLTLQGGIAGGTVTENNGAHAILSFSMAGWKNVVLSMAIRRSSTGFNSNKLAYSTDGSSYTDITTFTPTTDWAVQSFDLSSYTALNNASTAYIRLTFSGASADTGNNRLDNIQLNAEAVPEPFTMALGAAGLAVAVIRRRRSANR